MQIRMPHSRGLLTPAQREILQAFQLLPDAQRFYLTGGTALSEFYLGHRRSFDLDLFTTEQRLVLPFSRIVEQRFAQGFAVRVIRRLESFVEFELGWQGETVRVQLAYDSPYRFAPPHQTPLGWVNDFQDLIVDKVLAFFGRAEPRDAVDLFVILETEDLEELTRLALQKDPGFDLYWFAQALQKTQEFPDEVGRWPVELVRPLDPKQLKKRFQEIALEIMAKLHPRS
ncbi:MAG: nucleotidyl transferase AbiEii/AbiGii toxin family protein [Candidatus Bipolaricaulota bacterium]|nr:nucleotidyl transferase AbiEii/AbiGii toxin family protein [Candidatus Bipolaricaulota bacterium]MDW8140778.1 nucleotidyl transferase AbiEii/AbiGii toxin family protein [Candidatus Bipolaricaulota bacterium]